MKKQNKQRQMKESHSFEKDSFPPACQARIGVLFLSFIHFLARSLSLSRLCTQEKISRPITSPTSLEKRTRAKVQFVIGREEQKL
jgi:hypothetical protein